MFGSESLVGEIPRRVRPTYTGHARDQMAARGVPEEAVERVLAQPEYNRAAVPRRGAKPAEIYFGDYGNRRLRVYVEIGTNPPKVKTVAWED